MAIRSIAHLKSYFKSVPEPHPLGGAQFTDLFDTLAAYEDMAYAAVAASSPVIIVTDQAARLALGPSVHSGQRVKQTDNGVTYSKQHAPGSNDSDWEPFGDTVIVIADVVGLQAALDSKLLNDDDDASVARLGMRNNRLAPLGTWAVLTGPDRVALDGVSNGLNYVEAPGNFSFHLITPPGSMHGRSVTGVVYNPQGSSVSISLGVGMLGTNSEWPLVLGPGKYMQVTFTFLRIPDALEDTVLVAAITGI